VRVSSNSVNFEVMLKENRTAWAARDSGSGTPGGLFGLGRPFRLSPVRGLAR
jgi:hypothetical protein